MITHAEIIPLIGGAALASTEVFGSKPEYILSYSPFKDNESHLLNYFDHEVPYFLLDQGGQYPYPVDIVGTTCPCAGLSMFSTEFGEHNPNNRWMIESTKYVLGEMKPRVLWGENSSNLAGKIGEPILKQLLAIGKENGYTTTVYRTRSLLHGVPQVRERVFYFFWRGNKTPLLEYFDRPYEKIEDVIMGAGKYNSMQEPINKNVPTNDPYYRYLLEVVHGGITHAQHFDLLDTTKLHYLDALSLIEHRGHSYQQVGQWMKWNGHEKEVAKCERMHEKLLSGGNIMRRGTIVPKDYIGAFVGHYPKMLTHPHEDRYITYREAMSIMGLPPSFELLNPSKSYNHICQNVPFQTARDMASEVKAVLYDARPWIDADLVYQYNATRSHEIMSDSSNLSEFF